jgi:hypothetical protein
MSTDTEVRTVTLADGTQFKIEVRRGTYQDASALDTLGFDAVLGMLESFSSSLTAVIERAKPTKAAIEFGMEVTAEAGKLTALICQGKATANFTVKFEWEKPK